jgi:hypothetical protein
MDPRTIFDYKCHKCKRTKEPGEYGFNNQTKTKRVTCNTCHQKRTEREDYRLRDTRLRAEAALMPPPAPETTEEEPRVIVYLPPGTSEEEPVCENGCTDRLTCQRVHPRYTCMHYQCIMTHCLLNRCVACGCSSLRFNREIMLSYSASSSSGGAIAEDTDGPVPYCDEPEGEPECEPEPVDPFTLFITSEY